jgi:hypothetical protein
LSLRLLQFIRNFTFELFAFAERVFDLLLDLAAPVVERFSLRHGQLEIFRLLERFCRF